MRVGLGLRQVRQIGAGGIPWPQVNVVPALSGTATIGSTLTCSTGTWSNSPTAYHYQWFESGVAVGTDANTYVPTGFGDYVYCVVTAANANGSGSAPSNTVGPLSSTAISAPIYALSTASGILPASYTVTGDSTFQPGMWVHQQFADAGTGFASNLVDYYTPIFGSLWEANDATIGDETGTYVQQDRAYDTRCRFETNPADSATNMFSPWSNTVTDTAYNNTPSTWDFIDQTGVSTSSTITSAAVTAAGYTGGAQVITNGNPVSINGGAFSTAQQVIAPGQSIAVRLTSSSSAGATTTVTINVGGVDVTFAATTAAAGVLILANSTQPAAVSATGDHTWTSQSLGAGTAIICLALEGANGAGAASVTITPTGGGTATTCTRQARAANTNTGCQDIWTSNGALAAGNYDIAITYSGGAPTIQYLMHAYMTGQTSNTPVDTCSRLFNSSASPYSAADSLVVNTNGQGLVFEFEWGSVVSAWNSGYTELSHVTGSNTTRVARSIATGTPAPTGSGSAWVGMIGASWA